MLQNNQTMTTSERMEELTRRLEQSEMFDIEGAKFDISEHVFSVMERQGVSKASLARKLGKSRAYVTKTLQGNANFTVESLVKIARALDCRLDMTGVLVPAYRRMPVWERIIATRHKMPVSRPAVCNYIRLVGRPVIDKENDDNARLESVA